MDQVNGNQGHISANLAASAIFRLTMENEALRAQLEQERQINAVFRKKESEQGTVNDVVD